MQQALHSLRASSLLTLLAPTEQGFYATTSRIWEQRKLDLLQFRMPTHKRTSEGGGGGAKLLGLTMGLSLAIEAHVFKKKKKKVKLPGLSDFINPDWKRPYPSNSIHNITV